MVNISLFWTLWKDIKYDVILDLVQNNVLRLDDFLKTIYIALQLI